MRRGRAGALLVLLIFAGLASASDTDEPFGRPTIEAAPPLLRATWQQIEDKIRSEQEVIKQCRVAPPSCTSSAADRLNDIVREGDSDDDSYEDLARIGRINRAVNLAIKPRRADADSTDWTSPLETLAIGTGDCKQYAVVKYAALLEAGFAPERVRLVIVQIKPTPPVLQPVDHAVIAVRVQSRWMVLDNRSLRASESTGLLDQLEPLFTLDNRGVRQFVPLRVGPTTAIPCDDKEA